MGKKAKEFKTGDFIFAKVKGYPAWPARIQGINGKKYFIYFYGTGEIANLPANQIFDYAENKDKFLTKAIKRKDFNDGAKQIEYDFINNVPIEQVVGVASEAPQPSTSADDTADGEADESTADTTMASETADESVATVNETAVEDSDDGGALVIDEGKKSKKPAKELPKSVNTPKTPRGRPSIRKEETPAKKEEVVNDEEIVSRSGRKIKPKRYVDEQADENATLPSPVPKRKRVASPIEKTKPVPNNIESKDNKQYNSVSQSEIEDLKEPFSVASDGNDKENILIVCLPSGQYVGVKLFQGRPASFKNEAARLQWDKQAAKNAIRLKLELERGHITSQSVATQLETELNLTDEEKANIDKEREIEDKKTRAQFLKTEMKLIELDAKIKTCLSLEKADTDLCLKLLDELMDLEVKSLMLLKHPTCLETIKRMRCYVGNIPTWDLSEDESLTFSKKAHNIRKKAEVAYEKFKGLYTTPEGLSFWEYFSERVVQFKKCTADLNADELLEMVHEPLELSQPSAVTMKSAIDEVTKEDTETNDKTVNDKKKVTPVKNKKTVNSTPAKSKKQTKKQDDNDNRNSEKEENEKDNEKQKDDIKEKNDSNKKEDGKGKNETKKDDSKEKNENKGKTDSKAKPDSKSKSDSKKEDSKEKNDSKSKSDNKKDDSKTKAESKKDDSKLKIDDSSQKDKEVNDNDAEATNDDSIKVANDKSNEVNDVNKKSIDEEKTEDKEDIGEPKPKRGRESNKKTESTPRTPAKRKSSKHNET